MTRYSRSVIPGRQASERDLDRQVFGEGDDIPAANDAENGGPQDIPVAPKRRRGRRADDDFRPLPGERGVHDSVENKRAPLVAIGVLVTLGVFGFVVWNAYSKGVRSADAEATPELADAGPFKVRPAETTTKATTPEQATVFERVEPGARPATSIVPTPDVREAPVVAPPVQVAAAPAPTLAPAPVTAAPVAAAPATPPGIMPAPVKAPPPLATPKVETPAAAPAVAKPAEPKLAGAYKPAFSKDGSYLVQVAAAPTEEAAADEWTKRLKAQPELYASAQKVIVRADVNGRTVYRVRAGAFATAGDANAFCDAIKAKGGDCFRTSK